MLVDGRAALLTVGVAKGDDEDVVVVDESDDEESDEDDDCAVLPAPVSTTSEDILGVCSSAEGGCWFSVLSGTDETGVDVDLGAATWLVEPAVFPDVFLSRSCTFSFSLASLLLFDQGKLPFLACFTKADWSPSDGIGIAVGTAAG